MKAKPHPCRTLRARRLICATTLFIAPAVARAADIYWDGATTLQSTTTPHALTVAGSGNILSNGALAATLTGGSDSFVNITAIPEPRGGLVVGLGLLAMVVGRRRTPHDR